MPEVQLKPQAKRRTRPAPVVRKGRDTRSRQSRPPARGVTGYLPVLAFGLLYSGVAAVWGASPWIAGLYLAISVVCFAVYAADKSAAVAGRWRVPESTLLILGLVGGWPGAVVAQQALRHKSNKAGFRVAFWATVALNVLAFAWLHTPLQTLFRQ